MVHHCHVKNTPKCCKKDGGKHGWDCPYRQLLWVVLILNGGMFLVEMIAGSAAQSQALLADALDFFADASNYAISLFVLNKAVHIRAKASLVKAGTMILLGCVVVGGIIYNILYVDKPDHLTMGGVGFLALLVNILCALLLYRFRFGDSNRESAWICSRNDAVGNIAVMIAAVMVYATDTKWPDIVVAAIMAGLAIQGAWVIFHHARAELKDQGCGS